MAVTQVSALQAKQKSNEKEVETLKRQILDYQVTWFCFQLLYLSLRFLT